MTRHRSSEVFQARLVSHSLSVERHPLEDPLGAAGIASIPRKTTKMLIAFVLS